MLKDAIETLSCQIHVFDCITSGQGVPDLYNTSISAFTAIIDIEINSTSNK